MEEDGFFIYHESHTMIPHPERGKYCRWCLHDTTTGKKALTYPCDY